MDWEDLRHFLAVARAGSVTGAAKDLRVSASTVMKRIGDLEASLGDKLFERSRDGYSLTSFGKLALERAEAAEAGAVAVWRLADAKAEMTSEPLCITTTDFMASHWLAPRIGRFLQAHRMAIDLVPAAARLSLDRREADLSLRIGRPDERGLFAKRIGSLATHVYGRCEIPANELPWIGLVESRQDTPFGRDAAAAMGDERPALRTVNFNVMLEAVRAGVGKAQLPCFVGDADSALARIEVPNGRAENELWLVVHRDLRDSRRVRQLMEFIASEAARGRDALEGRIKAD